MRAADRSGARYALVLGDRDLEAGTIGIKDLTSGEQQDVPLEDAQAELLRLLRAAPASPG
jgi:histidyl-tRNA synthetase